MFTIPPAVAGCDDYVTDCFRSFACYLSFERHSILAFCLWQAMIAVAFQPDIVERLRADILEASPTRCLSDVFDFGFVWGGTGCSCDVRKLFVLCCYVPPRSCRSDSTAVAFSEWFSRALPEIEFRAQ